MKRKTRWLKALCLALVLSVVLSLCGVAEFSQECSGIRDNVLRLHVLANSDSEEDQANKLAVRDAILEETRDVTQGAQSKKEAIEKVTAALPRLKEAAERCLKQAGCEDAVTVQLRETYFGTREYESGTLPAGWYTALRVTIGAGAGHNWWCVVYPAMCLSSAQNRQYWSEVLDDSQCDIVQHPDRYAVRFKIVEWLQQAWAFLTGA